ncbi:30S ribosomal protein S1 [Desulfopila aestuarii]|uniref:SSU ribosomal protein S1P n=1 Tax=Desulfopila aestuarii DSM 18488 TaxID=1121416 RepID=A0A1M7XZZ3_9BACT|nr:30S ribosomal protein S1 [Desulfopila aestuarii]SHO44582.1 SSU ribosomal protein S1P [Desulfopila aestuarii DSM 18488]
MDANNESFADLFKQEETKKLRHFSPGQKVKASIIAVSGDSVFLDVGGKSEGVLNSAELKDETGEISAKPGDRIEVYFLRSSGAEMVFTAKLGGGSGNEQFEEAYRSGIPVEGLVKAEIKGGFEITLGGNARAFCPFSQMGLRRVEDAAAEYLDTKMLFRITRFDENGRNIVVSARAIQEEEREAKREELQKTLAEGDLVEGEISSIRDFGAFVDLGGVDGLIPISEVGWTRIENVSEFFTVGQKVKVIVKKLDWDNNRISLSYKETQADPWAEAANNFQEGSTRKGTVSRLAQFGAFVTLAEGVDGLIHISKLGGGRRINHPREVLEAGQEVEVVIESIDTVEKRISLAPVDYESAETVENKEKADYVSYVQQAKKKEKSEENLGSFGALLKAKMKEKK